MADLKVHAAKGETISWQMLYIFFQIPNCDGKNCQKNIQHMFLESKFVEEHEKQGFKKNSFFFDEIFFDEIFYEHIYVDPKFPQDSKNHTYKSVRWV